MINETLNETLKAMPAKFSSIEFCREARRRGITQSSMDAGLCRNFLLINCIRQKASTWTRKPSQSLDGATLFPKSNGSAIDSAIALLKTSGYKVLKPTYTEI